MKTIWIFSFDNGDYAQSDCLVADANLTYDQAEEEAKKYLENVVQAIVEQYLYYQGECEIDPQNAQNEAIGIAQDTVKAIQEVEKIIK